MSVVFDGEHFGNRDVLFVQSLDLLKSKFSCLFFGCGFNYFQVHYGYEFGMYPHNFILEMFITFGILVSIPILFLVLIGLLSEYINKPKLFFIYASSAYLLGIAFKSGTLISIYEFPIIIYFAFIGLKTVSTSNYIQKLKTSASFQHILNR